MEHFPTTLIRKMLSVWLKAQHQMHKSTSVSSGSGTDPLQVDRIPPQVSHWAEINVFSACKVPLGSNFIGKWARGDMFSRSKRNRMGGCPTLHSSQRGLGLGGVISCLL